MYIYNIGERSINRSATRLTGLARGLLRHFVRVCEPVFNGRISTVFNGRIKTFHHMIWFLRAHTSECARQHSCSPPASAPNKEWIYFRLKNLLIDSFKSIDFSRLNWRIGSSSRTLNTSCCQELTDWHRGWSPYLVKISIIFGTNIHHL